MGVDFVMKEVRPVEPPGFAEIEGGGTRFSQRLFVLSQIFVEEFEGMTFGRKIRAELAIPVTCRWFKDAYMGFMKGDREPDLRDCWNPQEILGEVRAICDFLQAHDADFPRYFFLRERPSGQERGGCSIVLSGKAYSIRSEWGRCVARPMETDLGVPSGTGEIEFPSGSQVHCRMISLSRRPNGGFGDVLASDITLDVQSISFFEHFRGDLGAMMALSAKAAKAGHLVFTYVS